MTAEPFLDGKVTLWPGDCLDVMRALEPNSVDAGVTDPPYHLTANKKGGSGVASINLDSPYGRARIGTGNGAGGFMGKAWDGGDIAFRTELWSEVLRVLKPGGYLLAFGGTRTFGRMQVAIEDAGFDIRDTIMWLYGSGFPKSLDVSKAIDKAAGAEREVLRERYTVKRIKPGATVVAEGAWGKQTIPYTATDSAPATDDAREWEGFGTALKPACEPIVLARKPLSESSVAANVLKWGTGALNIDGCRIPSGDDHAAKCASVIGFDSNRAGDVYGAWTGERGDSYSPRGRWPANIIHDGSDEVLAAFPDREVNTPSSRGASGKNGIYGHKGAQKEMPSYYDSGSAARFFYTAKADADDRLGSKHPTVKPLDLMQYLVRLVTPPRGLVLDPFAGTGTTGEAAWREGMRAVLIEREAEYQIDIRRRMALCLAGPAERKRESAKARPEKPFQAGSLFATTEEAPKRA